ncbi:holin family protein [Marinobacter sp. MDS2]|uniref:holin family protein n=1 Tax=Marinobacter sp. MDS2 TaxID=3065961 RepID=UPI00273C1504|nr:holin family protein [Marinobacter sp. MDS2]MDP4546499.1 holin family protein [Marinobacter sp. MDS2]
MAISIPVIDGLLDVGGKLIDKIWPDPAEREKAKAQLLQMQQNGELKELETRMSAILAEANSKDGWTSRARPSFLYVMYAMILSAIPMGILHAFQPELAQHIAAGMQAWLAALPEELWWLFGAGYLGYNTARSVDKRGLLKGLGR